MTSNDECPAGGPHVWVDDSTENSDAYHARPGEGAHCDHCGVSSTDRGEPMIHEPLPVRNDPVIVDADGITSCCGAYTSIFADDGVEYCKGCYRGVEGYSPKVSP